MTVHTKPSPAIPVHTHPSPTYRAEPWLIRLTRRWPVHYTLLALLPSLLLIVPGLIVYWRDVPAASPNARLLLNQLLTPSLIIAYSLIMIRYLYDATAAMLRAMRPAILVSDDEYEHLTYRMLTVDRRVDWLILGLGLIGAASTILYQYRTYFMLKVAERHPVLSLLTLTSEIVMGVLVALFVYTGFERGLALYRLFRHPLDIDPFDETNLSPLNTLSLRVTLALIGLVTLPILVTGGFRLIEPVQLVVFLGATFSAVVAFLLPLWGAHQYMDRAKEREMRLNSAKLKALYRELHDRVDRKTDGRDVADEVNALVQYQRLLESSPTWPYKGMRIGLQLAAPIALPLLVYVLQELLGPLMFGVTK
ncbi:MAG: hypothetical protein KIT87_04210 [Anaerolineae bacterium]|nr:hypothetical protein [Anaerolineae bacterium]